ncbi:hypothetical protein NAS2_0871 [Conexivisphaera calida]|uniref:Uncharacterized protein n=1 Tax=Conexivisphaera calida TaxID=1874277 RepID=A0A4V0P1M7_9ARCH|nr:hypothetical protein NAS2_0871 [Conexivisphaera calida]
MTERSPRDVAFRMISKYNLLMSNTNIVLPIVKNLPKIY